MQHPLKERIARLREEIAQITEANRQYVQGRKSTLADADQERRRQRLEEILDGLSSLTDWKKDLKSRQQAFRMTAQVLSPKLGQRQ